VPKERHIALAIFDGVSLLDLGTAGFDNSAARAVHLTRTANLIKFASAAAALLHVRHRTSHRRSMTERYHRPSRRVAAQIASLARRY
jgi:hypothetical protein